jgi:two-component system, OmpR family, alkaline phosphatase synthesis response regulator PhoP
VSKKKILIVDDEESLLKLASLLLTSRGYKVEAALDGKSALDSMAKDKPDLVLLDIMMPGLNGFEVCQQIKSNVSTRNIPVIMLTAKKSSEDMSRAEQLGAEQYITKPFRSAHLIETIKQTLSGTLPHFSPEPA